MEKGSVRFLLDGDLSQMLRQEEFLSSRGMDVGHSDVYPGLYTEEDFKKALKLIWDNRVDGWWNYKTEYINHAICTSELFDSALNVPCA